MVYTVLLSQFFIRRIFAVYSKQCIFVINKQFLTMAVFVGQFNPFEMIAAEIVLLNNIA